MASTLKILIAFTALAVATAHDTQAETLNVSPQVDFTALLSRTDEIKVCVNTVRVSVNQACSDTFYEIMEARCTCTRDLTRSLFSQANVENPVIINAAIQLSMNEETNRLAFEELDIEFLDYTEERMLRELNISQDELFKAVDNVGSKSAEFRVSSYEAQTVHLKSIPSCAFMSDLTERHFPSLHKTPNSEVSLETTFCTRPATENE